MQKLTREMLAFIVSPLVPGLLGSILISVYFFFFSRFEEMSIGSSIFIISFASIPTAYCAALFIGLPLYLIFRANRQITLHHIIVSASAIGMLVMFVVGVLFGSNRILELTPVVVLGGALGLAGGIVFWLMIRSAPKDALHADVKLKRG